MKTKKDRNRLHKNSLKLNWTNKMLYREVTLWPEDFKKLVRILKRLENLYYNAQIVHTRDIDELKLINKSLKTLLKKYDEAFENHSV